MKNLRAHMPINEYNTIVQSIQVSDKRKETQDVENKIK
jgi:hypothetical protein